MLETKKGRNRAEGGTRWGLEGVKAHKGMRGGNTSVGREQITMCAVFGLVSDVCFGSVFAPRP